MSPFIDLQGLHLAGGQWSKLSYDFFVGAPISKPEDYRTAKVTLGFNLNVGF